MADLWGDPGPEVQWGFDSSTPIGGVADVVAEVISVSDGSVLAWETSVSLRSAKPSPFWEDD